MEHVDRELVIVPMARHQVGCRDDGPGPFGIQHAELGVGQCGGLLHLGQRLDVPRFEDLAGDREVLHGTLGLGAVEGLGGHPDLAHGVVFDAEFRVS